MKTSKSKSHSIKEGEEHRITMRMFSTSSRNLGLRKIHRSNARMEAMEAQQWAQTSHRWRTRMVSCPLCKHLAASPTRGEVHGSPPLKTASLWNRGWLTLLYACVPNCSVRKITTTRWTSWDRLIKRAAPAMCLILGSRSYLVRITLPHTEASITLSRKKNSHIKMKRSKWVLQYLQILIVVMAIIMLTCDGSAN